MALVKFTPQPGVYRDGTQFSASGRWWDCQWVRFRRQFPEKIGGWVKAATATFLGTCRRLFAWTLLSGANYVGVGTHLKYYAYTGGQFTDITPIRVTVNPMANNPFTTGAAGSAIVTVTQANHGAIPNDFVTFSGATGPVDGIPASDFNTELQILTVPSTSTFTVRAATVCTLGGVAGGGAAVIAEFQINTGLDTSVVGDGWGAGPWGGSYPDPADNTGWGEAANTTVPGQEIRLWSNDNFGEDLIICPRNGAIYFWDATNTTARAVNLDSVTGAADVPTIATEIIVSSEDRHVLAFGCNPEGLVDQDTLQIRWSDAQNAGLWTNLTDNTAGEIRLGAGSFIVTALHNKRETLVWTDTSLHSLQFTGPPFTFSLNQVAFTITIMGPLAKVAVNDATYWMGYDQFYRYDGQVLTIPCDVRDFVFLNINREQSEKVHAGSVSSFSEVWWFYCSATATEIDSYVVYNYESQIWYYGTLSRTAWIDRSTTQFPQAAADGTLYLHESGADDGSTDPVTAIPAFIESGPFEVEGLQSSPAGDQFGFLWRMIPDVTFRNSTAASPTVDLILTPREEPGSAEGTATDSPIVQSSTVTVEQFTTISYIRLRCRQLTLKAQSSAAGVLWRLGVPRIDVRTDGRR